MLYTATVYLLLFSWVGVGIRVGIKFTVRCPQSCGLVIINTLEDQLYNHRTQNTQFIMFLFTALWSQIVTGMKQMYKKSSLRFYHTHQLQLVHGGVSHTILIFDASIAIFRSNCGMILIVWWPLAHLCCIHVKIFCLVSSAQWRETKWGSRQTGSRTPCPSRLPSWCTLSTRSATRTRTERSTPAPTRWAYCAATWRCSSSCPRASGTQSQCRYEAASQSRCLFT